MQNALISGMSRLLIAIPLIFAGDGRFARQFAHEQHTTSQASARHKHIIDLKRHFNGSNENVEIHTPIEIKCKPVA